MTKKIYVLLFLILPLSSIAQSKSAKGVLFDSIVEKDCNGMAFVRVEVPPSFKNGKISLEDSISSYLKSRGSLKNNTKGSFKLFVTKQSTIINVIKIYSNFPNDSILEDAFKLFSYMWLPATQNGFPVCAYVSVEIELSDDKLKFNSVY